MTESSPSLHPALQKLAAVYRRRLRSLGLFGFFMMSGILLFVMVRALTSQDLGSLLTLGLTGLVLLPGIALAGGLMWYVDRTATKKLVSAHQLLSDRTAQIVRLTPVKALISGHLVEMVLSTQARIYAAFEPSAHLLPRHEIEVQLFGRTFLQGDQLVAFQPEGIAFLGKVVEPKEAQRRNQWLKIFMWIGLSLLIIVFLYFFGPLL